MKLLFIKTLEAFDGLKWWIFRRMHVYEIPVPYCNDIKRAGYAVQFGYISELPITVNNPQVKGGISV